MEFRKDSEVADWALDGAKPLGRPLQTWEREALRRKRRSLMRAATEMESMAMSGTASPKMAKVREETARKYRDQIAELEKVMARFKILEGRKMKITKRQLKRIIKEERAKLLREMPTTHASNPGGGRFAPRGQPNPGHGDNVHRAIEDMVANLIDNNGYSIDEAFDEIDDFVEDVLADMRRGMKQTADEDFDPDRPY